MYCVQLTIKKSIVDYLLLISDDEPAASATYLKTRLPLVKVKPKQDDWKRYILVSV